MTAPDLLERLRSLDVSSADFSDKITKLLRSEEYREYVQSLQGENLTLLVGILDNVRLCVDYPHFTQPHCRSSAISIQHTLPSRSAFPNSGGYAVLGDNYPHLAQFQTFCWTRVTNPSPPKL
jgi:hypothetical protein